MPEKVVVARIRLVDTWKSIFRDIYICISSSNRLSNNVLGAIFTFLPWPRERVQWIIIFSGLTHGAVKYFLSFLLSATFFPLCPLVRLFFSTSVHQLSRDIVHKLYRKTLERMCVVKKFHQRRFEYIFAVHLNLFISRVAKLSPRTRKSSSCCPHYVGVLDYFLPTYDETRDYRTTKTTWKKKNIRPKQ